MRSLRRIRIVVILVPLLIIMSFVDVRGQSPTDTVVVYRRGHAEVKFKAAAGFERLVTGARLHAGDIIETGDKSKVELELADESTVVIGANSRVMIKELNTVEVTRVSMSVFELLEGKIRAIVVPFGRKDSEFTIETNNATIGVRGTDFGVTYDPNTTITHLLTVEGTVYLMLTYFPDALPITVIGGEEITVPGKKPPSKPSKAVGNTVYQFLQEMIIPSGGGWNHNEGGGQSNGRTQERSIKY